jgi:leucyl aminopeptidase
VQPFQCHSFTTSLAKTSAQACLLGRFEGEPFSEGLAELDDALEGALRKLGSDSRELEGKPDSVAIIHTLGRIGPKRLCIAGLGRRSDFTGHVLRRAAGLGVRKLAKDGCADIAIALHKVSEMESAEAVKAVAEGLALGAYRTDGHKSSRTPQLEFTFRFAGDGTVKKAAERGITAAEGANFARWLTGEPANILTPTHMAEVAMELAAGAGLKASVLDETDMDSLGMGLLLSVTRGSEQPARLIIVNHRPRADRDTDLALVGKGITFDTGGISLKHADGLGALKGDMAGAAAVLGTMKALARLQIPVNVLGVIPAAENMPSGGASRPGDVVQALDGTTVEIITTDAEGRMVLADALAYTRKLGAKCIVDVATLTGAVGIALGPFAVGAMATDDALFEELRLAAEKAGEPVWRLPLWEEYNKLIKSDVADLANAAPRRGSSRTAGAIVGGKFLQHFVGDLPWAHLDIAATASGDGDGWLEPGPTGVPVRTLVNLAERISAGKS